jgi:hypothetical protein
MSIRACSADLGMELGLVGLTPHGLGLLVDLPLLANGLARHLLSVVGRLFSFRRCFNLRFGWRGCCASKNRATQISQAENNVGWLFLET